MENRLVFLPNMEPAEGAIFDIDEHGKDFQFTLNAEESLEYCGLEFTGVEYTHTDILSEVPDKNILCDGSSIVRERGEITWKPQASSVIIDFGRSVLLSQVTITLSAGSIAQEANIFISEGTAWFPPTTVQKITTGQATPLPMVMASKIMVTPGYTNTDVPAVSAPTNLSLTIDDLSIHAHYIPRALIINHEQTEHFSWNKEVAPQSIVSTGNLQKSLLKSSQDGRTFTFSIQAQTLGKLELSSVRIDTVSENTLPLEHPLLTSHHIPFGKTPLGTIMVPELSEIKSVECAITRTFPATELYAGAESENLNPLLITDSVSYAQQCITPKVPISGIDICIHPEEPIDGMIRFFGGTKEEPDAREFSSLATDFALNATTEPTWHHISFEKPVLLDSEYVWIAFSLSSGKALIYTVDDRSTLFGNYFSKPVGSSWITLPDALDTSALAIRIFTISENEPSFKLIAQRGLIEEPLTALPNGAYKATEESLNALNTYPEAEINIVAESSAYGDCSIDTVTVAYASDLKKQYLIPIGNKPISIINGIGDKKIEYYTSRDIFSIATITILADLDLESALPKLSASAGDQLEEYSLIAQKILENKIIFTIPDVLLSLSFDDVHDLSDETGAALTDSPKVFADIKKRVNSILLFIGQKDARSLLVSDLQCSKITV